ncbi:hypothetical protein OOT00_09625 [Desulfobotulus sp. H1]|uniref:Uncharacterized protein n=1 Tax=Desulfobotulus pelophilus TaxID=2823377 RepID=A0ABT3N9Y5_9BACT|nr:hypothetical protein [Desulfobotulus pelophilus]MCW7754245.1 hypothetical protein [Desulfobotulus pelophilus]
MNTDLHQYFLELRKALKARKLFFISCSSCLSWLKNNSTPSNHNSELAADVESNLDFAIFQNHGYKGLYGGLDAKGIHARKGLKKNQQILDNMGSTELAANLFRATQTEDKLRRENIQGKTKANATHFEVGKKVRQTIEELGGTMPEDLPTPIS